MIRNFKVLGLAVIAVFAMSAVLASAASADTFRLEASPTTLTGAQETGAGKNKFTVGGQAVECTVATFHKTVMGAALTEISGIVPNYEGCNYGTNAAEIEETGCTYTLTGTTDVNLDAETKVVCEGTKHIEIKVPAIKCVITVKKPGEANGSQVAAKGVHYTNIGAGTTREVTIDLTAKVKVIAEEIPGSGGSAACTTLSGFPNGELTGSILVSGETEVTNAHTGIEVTNP